MQKYDEWMFPDGEEHLQKWMTQVGRRIDGRLTYQYGKYEEALKYVPVKNIAIDVGAHVGLWSWLMARDFCHVFSVEPMPEHRQCFDENLSGIENVTMLPYALGEKSGLVTMARRTANSSGDTHVESEIDGNTKMVTLDSFDFVDCSLLKIDCEGYELNVLRGAKETLLRCKPCVIVEQKGFADKYGHGKLDGVKFLEELGAKVRSVISGDYILSWD